MARIQKNALIGAREYLKNLAIIDASIEFADDTDDIEYKKLITNIENIKNELSQFAITMKMLKVSCMVHKF